MMAMQMGRKTGGWKKSKISTAPQPQKILPSRQNKSDHACAILAEARSNRARSIVARGLDHGSERYSAAPHPRRRENALQLFDTGVPLFKQQLPRRFG